MNLKHGLSRTPEYQCWQQIKARCLNSDHQAYLDYGGRGVTIYEGWVKDFESFLLHIGPRPSSKHSLDRIDNNRGYEPGNLRWATQLVQTNNRRPHRPHGVKVHKSTVNRVTNFKHGMIHTPEYKAWVSMKDRCLNPKSSNYHWWGERGITIYPPWVGDFMQFYQEVGPRPSVQHSLDRIDNNRGYEPGNVRWATKLEQRHNQRPYTTGPEHGNFDHGYTRSPEFRIWTGIKTKCFNSKSDRYEDYGGVGVTMCQRWKDNFVPFFEDLGSKPSPGHRLLRNDLDGNYSCGKCEECLSKKWVLNCRWGSVTEQNRTRRSSSRSGKLDIEKVNQIRAMRADGVRAQQVAKVFGVGVSLVYKIENRENWA